MNKSGAVKYSTLVFLLLTLGGFLLTSPGCLARETFPPKDPLVVPIGESSELWEMGDLKPGKTGGRVQFSTDKFPDTFNDLLAGSKASTDVTRMIMGSGLIGKNPVNGHVTPGLAESWEVSEDGLTYTFHLRKGLKFSDGHPLTAEDVVFTYQELIFDPKVETDTRDLLRVGGKLPEVKKVDELTVRFELPEPFGFFPRRVSTGIYPEHKLADLSGEEFNALWGRKTAEEDPEEIVGAGPFKLQEFVPGEKIVMTRNPYYYKTDPGGTQLPYLDGYSVLKVKNDDVQFLKFKNNETDLLRPQIEDMPYLLSRYDEEDWRIYTGDDKRGAPMSAEFMTFNWNTENEELVGLFRETDFRKAVSLAIDRNEIIEEVFNSFGQLQFGPISRLSPYHNAELKDNLPYEFDSDEGNRILDELGVRDENGDGIRELSPGNPVEFEILVNKGNRVRLRTGKIIVKNLKRIGIEASVMPVGFEEFSSRLVGGDYSAVIVSLMTNPAVPVTLSDIFTTSGPLHLWHPGADVNPTQWEEEIDRLFGQARRASSFSERKSYFDEFQEIYARELPLIYVAGESFLYATNEDLRNTKEFSRLGTFLSFAEYVWVEE
ncbi:MAG: ABC transporter substrate-binding protein [Candidatus Acetothermia bacterium]